MKKMEIFFTSYWPILDLEVNLQGKQLWIKQYYEVM